MATITYTLDLGVAGEVDCEIEYRYSPGRPAVMYLRNGDPGHPADPAEVNVLKVTAKGVDITDLVMHILEEDEDFMVAVDELESEQ